MTASVSQISRRTARFLACQRLSIFKGIPACHADITRRAFARRDADKIQKNTTKPISQHPADIKNEKNASDLPLDGIYPGST